jgi:predicted nucleic acid-binding protein
LGDAPEIFGEPEFPRDAEYQDIRVLRDELAQPGDQPTSHLGEAETIAIILRRRLTCFFVTDDRGAARLAAKNNVPTVTTWHLLKVAHRQGWVDADTLWGYVQTLRGQGRGGLPGLWDRSSLDKWLGA